MTGLAISASFRTSSSTASLAPPAPPFSRRWPSCRARRTACPKSRKTLEDAMRDHILQALEQTRWVVGGRHGTTAYLGLARTTLLAKMQRLGIESAREGLANRNAGRQAACATTA